MYKQLVLLLLTLFLSVNWLGAQQTSVYQEALVHYKRGQAFFDQELFAQAREEFDASQNRLITPGDHETEVLKVKTELMQGIAALRVEDPRAEVLLNDFVRNHSSNPLINKALYELGNYHYAARRYDEAGDYFARVESRGLSTEERIEVRFKQGYGNFVKKKFSTAKSIFSSIRNEKTIYYYPANYYYGMSSYYMNNFRDAIDGFNAASGSRRYKVQVPYYIVSIHFSQNEFDDVIRYGEEVLQDRSIQKSLEIGQMVGQAYFERGDYAKALPYLNEFADRNRRMSQEELYQVAYVNYISGEYEKATQYFLQTTSHDGEIGQLSNYYLADCQLKVGDKPSARSSFARAANMKIRQDVADDALFQYAKLSAELNADKDAIQALLMLDQGSPYYSEAQEVISDILINTNDFQNAIDIIESINNPSARLKEAYQKITYNQGLIEFNNRNFDAATALFEKSNIYPVDARLKAMSAFWTAEILHRRGDFKGSRSAYSSFLTMAGTVSKLPDPTLIPLANYAQGYNHIKQNDYVSALGYFEKTIQQIKKASLEIDDPLITKNVLGDAIMRAGDCHFSRNRYRDATKYYDEAVEGRYAGYDYAMFQKGVIAGLEGDISRKISILEDLVRTLPESVFAGDALYELGFAYEETGQAAKGREALLRLVNQYKGKSNLVNQGYIKLGLLSYNVGQKQQALEYYKSVFDNNPTRQEGEDALAAIEEIYVVDLGQSDAYFAFLESLPGYAIKGDARDSLSYRVAEIQFENGNYERAIDAYNDYLQKYPNGGYVLEAYYNQGECYLILKQYDKALNNYEQIITKGRTPYYVRSLEKAAIISYNDQRDFDRALQYYKQLIDATSNENLKFEAQLGAMRSAYRLDDLEEAAKYTRGVIENPRSSADNKSLAFFIAGKVHYSRQNWPSALQAFGGSIEQVDNTVVAAEARYLIATIYFKQKNYEKSEEWARAVMSESAAYADYVARSLILLSDIYLQAGDLINARAALEVVIENYDGDDQRITKEAELKLEEVTRRDNASNKGRKTNDDEIDFDDFNN